jgi:hypothetical protein
MLLDINIHRIFLVQFDFHRRDAKDAKFIFFMFSAETPENIKPCRLRR